MTPKRWEVIWNFIICVVLCKWSALDSIFPRTLKYSGIKLTTVLRSAKVKSRGIQESEATQQGGNQENKDLDFICSLPHLSFFPSISGQKPDNSEAPRCVTAQSASCPCRTEERWKLPATTVSHILNKIKKINTGSNPLKKFLNKCKYRKLNQMEKIK